LLNSKEGSLLGASVPAASSYIEPFFFYQREVKRKIPKKTARGKIEEIGTFEKEPPWGAGVEENWANEHLLNG